MDERYKSIDSRSSEQSQLDKHKESNAQAYHNKAEN